MDIKITKATELKTKPTLEEEASLGFGKRFTDHMFMMNYDNGEWHDARIVPYQRLSLDPSCSVLHYAQEIFEGLKAYRADDGRILMFRAKDNAQRLNNSARRLCMPEIDIDFNYEAMRQLVQVERDWVPHSAGTSLYLRPTMIAVVYMLHTATSTTSSALPAVHTTRQALHPSASALKTNTFAQSAAVPALQRPAATMPAPSLQVQRPKWKATARFCGWTASISSTFRKSAQ